MRFVGVLEAKTHLSRLLDELERTGEPLTITRHGKPLAVVTATADLSKGGHEREQLRKTPLDQGLIPTPSANRKFSGEELVKRIKALQAMQATDDAISWDELKEEIRR